MNMDQLKSWAWNQQEIKPKRTTGTGDQKASEASIPFGGPGPQQLLIKLKKVGPTWKTDNQNHRTSLRAAEAPRSRSFCLPLTL
jgi:hypothetical protein